MHKTILIFIDFFLERGTTPAGPRPGGDGAAPFLAAPGAAKPAGTALPVGDSKRRFGHCRAVPSRTGPGIAVPSRAEPVPAASPGRCRSALPSVPGGGRAPAAAGPGPGFSAAIGSRGWPGPRVSRGGPRGSPAGRAGPPAGTARAGVPQPRGEPPGAAGARGGPAAPGSRDPVLGQGQIRLFRLLKLLLLFAEACF